MEKSVSDLDKLVNSSGFMFQLGVAHAVAETEAEHGFTIAAIEHPWRDGSDDGFIDLILERGPLRLACECKRTRDADWVFLVEHESQEVDRVCMQWAHFRGHNPADFGWDDLNLRTSSYEATFCIVRGRGENDSPLLERLASKLTMAVEALAVAEAELVWHHSEDEWRLYLPVIITTAKLWVCRYLPDQINLATGTVSGSTFEEVSAVRFRKALTTVGEEKSQPTLSKLSAVQERTVLVVKSSAILEVLKDWRDGVIRDDSIPWRQT
jgi:hypothetical protein